MTVDSIKDLKAIMALCRKNGVTSIKIDGIELVLSPTTPSINAPTLSDLAGDIPEANARVPQYNGPNQDAIPTEGLTEEQLMFYSSAVEPGSEIPQPQ